MDLLSIVLFTLLLVCSIIILYQDFKERQVSLWVLLVFGLVAISSVLYYRDKEALFYSGIGIFLYGSLIWLILKLYLFLKFKRNKRILDEQLGLADVLVIFFIGLTFNTVSMIFFFSFGFVFSLISFLIYSILKRNNDGQSIPLAGLLVIFYVISIIVLNLIPFNPLIDCSFIMI